MKSALFVVFALTAMAVVLAGDSKDDDLMDLLISTLPENFQDIDRNDHVTYAKKSIEKLAETVCVKGKTVDAEGIAKEFVKSIKDAEAEKATICATIQKHFAKTMNPLAEAIDNCVDPELKGAPKTFVRTVVSVMDHTCKMNGEHLVELGNPCVFKIDTDKCISDLESMVRHSRNDMNKLIKSLNKEVCTTYAKERSCLEKQLGVNCKLAVTKEAVMGLMDAAFKTPCKA